MSEVKTKLHPIYSIDRRWLWGLKVNIDNQKGFLILDTGAQNSVLNSYFFPYLKFDSPVKNLLVKEKTEIVGITPESQIEFELISKLTLYLSKHKFQLKNVILTDISHIQSKFEKKCIILGLLGNDFLYQHKAVINYKTKTLELIKTI